MLKDSPFYEHDILKFNVKFKFIQFINPGDPLYGQYVAKSNVLLCNKTWGKTFIKGS